jgi:hypothetical protein
MVVLASQKPKLKPQVNHLNLLAQETTQRRAKQTQEQAE